MNSVNGRELTQYGIQSWKNYDLALAMLKSYKQDEFKSLGPLSESVGEPPVFACRSCRLPNYKHLLALANEDGKIGIQDTSSTRKESTSSNINCTQGHMNAIFDLSWSDSCLRLASVSGDHTAMLWDVSDRDITPIGMCEGHTRSVKVASFRPQSTNVFATGSRDGMVMIWDYRSPQQSTATIKPDNMVPNAHCQSVGSSMKKSKRLMQHSRAESITGLAFQTDNFLISCSAGDGVIKVWDIRKCYSIYHSKLPQACFSLPHPGGSLKNGFTSLSVDAGAVRLYANCMDSNIYCYNISTYEKKPVAKYTGHQNSKFYVKSCLSGDGQYLLSGSSDEKGYIWRVQQPGSPLVQLVGNTAEVTCVEWIDLAKYTGHQNSTFYVKSCLSGDGQYLLSGSSDEKGYIWRVQQPGSPLVQLVGHTAEVTCVEWVDCFDGDVKLVTCADDSSHRLWTVSPPTDDVTPNPDLVGWTEWVKKPSSVSVTTPGSVKRLARRHDFTPGYSDLKRLKTWTGEKEEGSERSVLAAVQLRTEGKGARRLFDCDSSSHCSGVEVLSPTSNLPNYVAEGTSPFHRCSTSSATKQKENWLAKLQTTPSPKQTLKKMTPKRRSQSQTDRAPKACGNLLKFFKIAAKQIPLNASRCDAQTDAAMPTISSSIKS